MTPIQQMLLGVGAKDKLYVDDVFSAYPYRGTANTAKTVTNGIDLAGEGGLVWIKNRDENHQHVLTNSVGGVGKAHSTHSTGAYSTDSAESVASFTSSGFSFGNAWAPAVNKSNNYASWTWRKAENFFDIVAYTGNGTSGRTISHALGSSPGVVIIKRTDGTEDWSYWHRSMDSGYFLRLNEDHTRQSGSEDVKAVSSTTFTVGNDNRVNANGNEYIAYIYAHHDGTGTFGETGDVDIIKCGTFTQSNAQYSTGKFFVDLGFEPQFLWVRQFQNPYNSNGQYWWMMDHARGYGAPESWSNNGTRGQTNVIFSQLSGDEVDYRYGGLESQGFWWASNFHYGGSNSAKYLYMAIRYPDGVAGKPAESASEVFSIDTGDGTKFDSTHRVDMAIHTTPSQSSHNKINIRSLWDLTTNLDNSNSEGEDTSMEFDWEKRIRSDASTNQQAWMWKRHKGFDVVSYRGTGSNQTVKHGLGQVPQMMWIKNRGGGTCWQTYHEGAGNTKYGELCANTAWSTSSTRWNDTTPTSSQFYIGTDGNVNNSGGHFVALLFASVDGICKVGSYTGNGETGQTIVTGFQPKFLLVKVISHGDQWVMYDTTRGWSNGNQDYGQYLSHSNAHSTQTVGHPASNGFTFDGSNGEFNGSGKTYIYLAHA